MIQLRFMGEDGDKAFQFLYDGLVIGGALVKEKGIQVLRTEANLLDKMEAISRPCECGRKLVTGEPARELSDKESESILELNFHEYDILLNYFEAVPWKTSISREIVKLSDWLRSCGREANVRGYTQ